MMPPLLPMAGLVVLLVGGFYAGPLIVLLHLIIAGFWYRRVKKENREDRHYRPATGPIYFVLGTGILCLYVGVFLLDRLLATVSSTGPVPGVSYFFWAICDSFGVGSWVDGALYDRAGLLIHTLLILPLLYFGAKAIRKRVLRPDPTQTTWLKRIVKFVAGLLGLGAFLDGGSELTATEAEAQRKAGGAQAKKWPPEGKGASWEITEKAPYRWVGYDPELPHETRSVFKRWLRPLVFACLFLVTISSCIGASNRSGNAFAPLAGLLGGGAVDKIKTTVKSVVEQLSGPAAIEGPWVVHVGAETSVQEPLVLVADRISASDPHFVEALKTAESQGRSLVVFSMESPEPKLVRILKQRSEDGVQHAVVQLTSDGRQALPAGERRTKQLQDLKATVQSDLGGDKLDRTQSALDRGKDALQNPAELLDRARGALSPVSAGSDKGSLFRGTADRLLEDQFTLGTLSSLTMTEGNKVEYVGPGMSPGRMRARLARAGQPVRDFLHDVGQGASAAGGIHYGTSKALWLAYFWFCVLLLMALDTTTREPEKEVEAKKEEEPPHVLGLADLLTAITQANAAGDVVAPSALEGGSEKNLPRPHGKLSGVGQNRCVWPGQLDDNRRLQRSFEANQSDTVDSASVTDKMSRLIKEFIGQLVPAKGDGAPASGRLMESQVRALERYAEARQRTSNIAASISSTGDDLIEERSAKLSGSNQPSHSLLIGPEGSGRTTTLALFAVDTVLSYCQRVLWICTDDRHREQLVNGGHGQRGLEDWFLRSNLRWGVKRAFGLSGPNSVNSHFVEGVRSDLVFVTLEELANIHMELPGRYDEIFTEVGMVIVDDLDRLSGLDEQQAYWVLRRLSARLGQNEDQLVSTLWCGSCSQVAKDGTSTWAEDLVGQNFDVIDFSLFQGAAQIDQYRFYLSEFIDKRRNPLAIKDLLRWLDVLKIPWHLRRCEASLRDLDLVSAVSGISSPVAVGDPRQAAVVILQGNFADAQREALRLAHAGSACGRPLMGFFMDVPAQQVSTFEVKDEGDPLRHLVERMPRAVSSRGNSELHKRQIDALHVECWQIGDRVEDLFEKDAVRSRQAEYGKDLQTEAFIDFTEDRQGFRTRNRVHLASGRWPVEPFTPGTATSQTVTILDRAAGKTLVDVDAAVADLHFYPGRVFLHPDGRFKVRERQKALPNSGAKTGQAAKENSDAFDFRPIFVERNEENQISSPRKRHQLTYASAPLDKRQDRVSIGRFAIVIEELPIQVTSEITGVDVLDSVSLKIVERRRFKAAAPKVDYATRAVFLRFEEHMEPKGGAAPVRLLVAAGRSLLPLLMRGCEDTIEIDLLGSEKVPEGLALWETIPGGMGYLSRFYDELVLDWLRLIRMRLERSVDLTRLIAENDHSGELGDLRIDWDTALEQHGESPLGRALAWLDGVLEGVSAPSQALGRVSHGQLPGEGQSGDIGRVWQSDSGRTDQLIWTEHRWTLSPRLEHLLQYQEAILHTAHERQTLESALLFSDNLEDLVARAQELGFLMRLEGEGMPSIQKNGEPYSEESLSWAISSNVAIDLAMERLRPLAGLFARVAQQLSETSGNIGMGRYLTAEFVLGFVQAMDHNEGVRHLMPIKLQKTAAVRSDSETQQAAGGSSIEFSDIRYDDTTKKLSHSTSKKDMVVHLQNMGKGGQKPRLHSHFCSTISAFKNAGQFDRAYIGAKPGAGSYRVIDESSGDESDLSLDLCGHCEGIAGAVQKATEGSKQAGGMDFQDTDIVSPLLCLAHRSGSSESKALLTISVLRLLGIDAMVMRNEMTGQLRLLVACDPTSDAGGAYDDELLKKGFEDEHCLVNVGGRGYFVSDVSEPLQPGMVGLPLSSYEVERFDPLNESLIQFFVSSAWKPVAGDEQAKKAIQGVQRQTGRSIALHSAGKPLFDTAKWPESIGYAAELTGLTAREVEGLVSSDAGWRLVVDAAFVEMADGSERLPVPNPQFAQPLLDGLRRTHFDLASADFKPERDDVVAKLGTIYELSEEVVNGWLGGTYKGFALDQGGGREAWRRHADYRIEAGETAYLLKGTASLSAGRFMSALARSFGKDGTHG